MSHAYSGQELVEQPAVALFGALGWQTVSARDEVLGADGTLGRESSGDVVLCGRLLASLERLNPTVPSNIAASVSSAWKSPDTQGISRIYRKF